MTKCPILQLRRGIPLSHCMFHHCYLSLKVKKEQQNILCLHRTEIHRQLPNTNTSTQPCHRADNHTPFTAVHTHSFFPLEPNLEQIFIAYLYTAFKRSLCCSPAWPGLVVQSHLRHAQHRTSAVTAPSHGSDRPRRLRAVTGLSLIHI